MSSGMFRGKESSNRIELSRLVQELLKFFCFGLPAALGKGQVGGGAAGGMEGCPHMHAHTCACMHTHTHTCIKLQMATSMEASMFSMFNMHVCACMHMCVCVCMHGTPPTHPYQPSPHPSICHPPRGDPRNQLKFDNT